MKRLLLVILSVAVFFSLASCGSPAQQAYVQEPQASLPPVETASPVSSVQTVPEVSSQPSDVAPVPDSVPASTPVPIVTPVPVVTPVSVAAPSAVQAPAGSSETAPAAAPVPVEEDRIVEGNGYSVKVLSAKADRDYTGADVIAVYFLFTNDNSEEHSFSSMVDVTVTQNGRTLNGEGVVMDGSSFNGCGMSTASLVHNGSSVKCACAFFSGSSDPIDVSVKIYNNFLDRVVYGSGSFTLSVE